MGNFLLLQNRPEAYSVLVLVDTDRGDGDDNGIRKKAYEGIETLSLPWPYF
jgi:hypothetical protein